MPLDLIEQIKHILKDKERILIVCPKEKDHDKILSSVALSLFLKNNKNHVEIVCDNFILPKQLSFIEEIKNIKPSFEDLKQCILEIDTENNGIKNIEYTSNNNKLEIFITPQKGSIYEDQIKIIPSKFKYDLIITIGAPNLNSIGSIFTENTELFYQTPILNIDNSLENEQYGEINFIDIIPSSISEESFYLLSQLAPELVDQKVATAILAGMASKTNRFQSQKTKPQTLLVASSLIEYGADLHFIMHNLYQNRTISTLRLWGKILSGIKYDKEFGIVWTSITRENFIQTKTDEMDLEDVLNEFILNSPEAKIVVLLYEDLNRPDLIHGIIKTISSFEKFNFGPNLKMTEDKQKIYIKFKNQNLMEAEEKIINFIKNNKTLP